MHTYISIKALLICCLKASYSFSSALVSLITCFRAKAILFLSYQSCFILIQMQPPCCLHALCMHSIGRGLAQGKRKLDSLLSYNSSISKSYCLYATQRHSVCVFYRLSPLISLPQLLLYLLIYPFLQQDSLKDSAEALAF